MRIEVTSKELILSPVTVSRVADDWMENVVKVTSDLMPTTILRPKLH